MIGIFYGSSMGTTETLAQQIAEKLGINASEIHDVANTPVSATAAYDTLLFGSSTWGYGDLQDDWEGWLTDLQQADLSGKKVGLFGCGDSESYPDTFCDAIGLIHEALTSSGCVFIGAYDPEGYRFEASKALVGGKLVGLAIDDVNESDQTPTRLERWAAALE